MPRAITDKLDHIIWCNSFVPSGNKPLPEPMSTRYGRSQSVHMYVLQITDDKTDNE